MWGGRERELSLFLSLFLSLSFSLSLYVSTCMCKYMSMYSVCTYPHKVKHNRPHMIICFIIQIPVGSICIQEPPSLENNIFKFSPCLTVISSVYVCVCVCVCVCLCVYVSKGNEGREGGRKEGRERGREGERERERETQF